MGNTNSVQFSRAKSNYSFPRYKWRQMKPTQNTKVTSWGSSSCDVDSHGQLTMVIDLARAYGVKRRDLQSVSLTTDCVFPPYDDSRLVTCISIQGVSPAARRVWIRSAVLLMEDAITIWNMNGHKRPTCGGPIIHDQKGESPQHATVILLYIQSFHQQVSYSARCCFLVYYWQTINAAWRKIKLLWESVRQLTTVVTAYDYALAMVQVWQQGWEDYRGCILSGSSIIGNWEPLPQYIVRDWRKIYCWHMTPESKNS